MKLCKCLDLQQASHSCHIIYEGALRLECALQELHAVSLLHIDVQSDSVVWNTVDMWHLTD